MSYFRGEHYLWNSDDALHIWGHENDPLCNNIEGYSGGVCIPNEIADMFAVMRFAELLQSGHTPAIIESAVAIQNFGANALRKHQDALLAFAKSFDAEAQPPSTQQTRPDR